MQLLFSGSSFYDTNRLIEYNSAAKVNFSLRWLGWKILRDYRIRPGETILFQGQTSFPGLGYLPGDNKNIIITWVREVS